MTDRAASDRSTASTRPRHRQAEGADGEDRGRQDGPRRRRQGVPRLARVISVFGPESWSPRRPGSGPKDVQRARMLEAVALE